MSCARKALLDNDETAADRKSRVRVQIGGFVWPVCGGCERAEQKRSGAEQRGGMRIQRENTAATPGYRAIEQMCKDRGWVTQMIRTEGVLDRKELLREHVECTRVRSGKVTEAGGERWVEILNYVEAGSLG